MLLKVIFILIAGGIVAAAVTRAVRGPHRRRPAPVPELNQHPERLEQMLDDTDDA